MDIMKTGDAELIRKEILSINLTPLSHLIADKQYQNFFLAGPGRENFKLVAGMAAMFPGQKVFDVGTYYGLNAVAMSVCPEVKIVSYDTQERKRLTELPPNVEFKIGDFRDDADLLTSPFLFIDAEPHDGVQEQIIHDFLVEKKYRGIVIWANINCNTTIAGWWKGLDFKRSDISNAGHWAGTGLIIYE
jgi:predicted O-methyltransferase YrrM